MIKDLLVAVSSGAQYVILTRMVDGKILVPLFAMISGPYDKDRFVIFGGTMGEMPSLDKRVIVFNPEGGALHTATVTKISEL